MNPTDYLDPLIVELSDEQKRLGGINIRKLPVDTLLIVRTRNSVYEIKLLAGKVEVRGGKYFPEWTEAHFPGSTFGGSMIKTDWIGFGMCMELCTSKISIHTSSVMECTIVTPQWQFAMEWESRQPVP